MIYLTRILVVGVSAYSRGFRAPLTKRRSTKISYSRERLSSILPLIPFVNTNCTRYSLQVVGTIPLRFLYLCPLPDKFDPWRESKGSATVLGGHRVNARLGEDFGVTFKIEPQTSARRVLEAFWSQANDPKINRKGECLYITWELKPYFRLAL